MASIFRKRKEPFLAPLDPPPPPLKRNPLRRAPCLCAGLVQILRPKSDSPTDWEYHVDTIMKGVHGFGSGQEAWGLP